MLLYKFGTLDFYNLLYLSLTTTRDSQKLLLPKDQFKDSRSVGKETNSRNVFDASPCVI